MDAGCIFCAIAESDAPAEIVYSDDDALAFMDINPATRGHALVIPRVHTTDLWTIAQDDAAHVMEVALRIARAMRVALAPDGLNLLQATGAVAFQTVFHFHLHVVPRYKDDEIRLPWIPVPGDPAEISGAARSIRDAL